MSVLLYVLAIMVGLLLAWLIIMTGRTIMFMIPIFHGPVFVPSADDKLVTMLKLAKVKKSDKTIDLGSGDGKILIALARQGFKVEGVEINPLLVNSSRRRVKKLGLNKKIKITRGNFWKLNFAKYDLVFLYGTSYIMKKLEKKLLTELKPGARVVSNSFQFPTWKPTKQENQVKLYVK